MVTDKQVRELRKLKQQGKPLSVCALKTGMDGKTARKYLRLGQLPSELKQPGHWRTREDPFVDVWAELEEKLALNPGLEAKPPSTPPSAPSSATCWDRWPPNC